MVSSSNHISVRDVVDQAGPKLLIMMCTDQDCMSSGPWVKHSGMRPGPMALASLGPSFGRRGRGYGPYCRVEVQGPSGPGDHVSYTYKF